LILEALFRLFFGLVDMFLGFLPDTDVHVDLSGLSAVSDFFGYANTFIDLNVVFACVGLALVVLNWSFFARIFNFVIRKIPFIG
jgi:hypothetical protein